MFILAIVSVLDLGNEGSRLKEKRSKKEKGQKHKIEAATSRPEKKFSLNRRKTDEVGENAQILLSSLMNGFLTSEGDLLCQFQLLQTE